MRHEAKKFSINDIIHRPEPDALAAGGTVVAGPRPRPGNRDFLYDSMERVTAGLNATGVVWVYLLRRSTVEKSRQFPVPNGGLAKLGVDRYQKTRALHNLAGGGVIEVEWRPKKSPLVTLLVPDWSGHAVRGMLQKRARPSADL
jgi:hypothetical protein